MNLLGRLILAFTLIPLLELLLLLRLADWLSWGPTLGLVILTGVLGAALARWQGWRAVQRIQEDTAAGRLPAVPVLDGAMILVAGALLVTPGVLTDLAGFSLLIPPVRAWLRQWAADRLQGHIQIIHTAPTDPFVDIDASPSRPADGPGPATDAGRSPICADNQEFLPTVRIEQVGVVDSDPLRQ